MAQEIQLQQPVHKTTFTEKVKQTPEVAIREPLHANRAFVNLNLHAALTLIALYTTTEHLNSVQFVYLHKLPIVEIIRQSLVSAITASKVAVDKTCEIEFNCGACEATGMFYVGYATGRDMILEEPALQDVPATMPAGTAYVSILAPGTHRFCLHMWPGNPVTDQNAAW